MTGNMGKPKPPIVMYRESVHDGSSVTISLLRLAPRDGMGNHSKPAEKRMRRHSFYKLINEARHYGQHEAIPNILAIYRGELNIRRV